MTEDDGGYIISKGKMVPYSFILRYTFSISSSFSAFLAVSMSMASLPLIKAHPPLLVKLFSMDRRPENPLFDMALIAIPCDSDCN